MCKYPQTETWREVEDVPFPSFSFIFSQCQVKNSIYLFHQPAKSWDIQATNIQPPQKLPNRAQGMRHWTFNCYSDPSTIVNSDQMIKSWRPWLPLFYVQKHHLLPSDKTRKFPPKYRKHGSQTQIHQYILMFKFQDSPFTCLQKTKSIRDAKETPSEQQRSETSNPRITWREQPNPPKKGVFFFRTRPPFPIFLAINTVSIGCQRLLPTVSPSFKAELS